MMHLYDDHSAHAFNVARGGSDGGGHLINMSSDHSSASIRPSVVPQRGMHFNPVLSHYMATWAG